MFSGINDQRVCNMTDQEKRWFHNLKKAFYNSDRLYEASSDQCMEEICKAVDVAKTLRRSLRGEPYSRQDNKKRFMGFLSLEIPDPSSGGLNIPLVESRTGKRKMYTFPELVYSVRCMIHENESLNVAESPNYHIKLDWLMDPNSHLGGRICNERVECNARFMWQRIREILAKFITGLESKITWSREKSFNMTVRPALGTIRPE